MMKKNSVARTSLRRRQASSRSRQTTQRNIERMEGAVIAGSAAILAASVFGGFARLIVCKPGGDRFSS